MDLQCGLSDKGKHILRFDKGTEILGGKGWTEKFRYFPIDQSEMDRAKAICPPK